MATGKAAHGALPCMEKKAQVTVRMTEQFAKDLNLVMVSYQISNASHVVQQSVAAQADAIRNGMAARQLAMQEEKDA